MSENGKRNLKFFMNKRIKKKLLSKQQQYIYGAIGFILHLSSLIEYNLIQLISAEKYLSVFDKETFTLEDIEEAKNNSDEELHKLTNGKNMLGKLIDKIESTNIFDESFINGLRRASEIRNYYAHRFFKEDLYSKYMDNCPLIYKKQINEDVGFLYHINIILVDMDKENRRLVQLARLNGFRG